MSIDDTAELAASHTHHTYQLAVAGLAFSNYSLDDPVPLGSQLLLGADLRPPDDYSLVALLPTGDFEDVGLHQTFDLRGKGVEKFIAFRSDRFYRLNANGSEVLWGLGSIEEAVLRVLTNAQPEQALFLDVPGGQDKLIPEGGQLNLTHPGVERVVLGPKPPRGFDITIIFNGRAAPQHVTEHERLQLVFDRARAAFGNPPGDLVLATEAGQILNLSATVKEAQIRPGQRLLLRPRVMQGG